MAPDPAAAPSVERTPLPEAPGLEAVVLQAGGLAATFVPRAGMVCSSLTDAGVQLLGLRGGLSDYLEHGRTFGIPLLAPWANRLAGLEYEVAGRRVVVDPATPGVRLDASGLPIHGVLGASPDWEVVGAAADARGARLHAVLDHGPSSPRFPAFPFEHRLEVVAVVASRELRVLTRVTATGAGAVPVAFGWHPYLAPPEAPREQWQVLPPSSRRAVLDARGLPTGEVVDDPGLLAGPLGARTCDDLLADVVPGARAELVAGPRRLALRYESGYPWAQVFAPPSPDVVALEPMTAPSDPFSGRWPLRMAEPGGPAESALWVLEAPPVGSAP